jgi:hypothetical protein
VPELLQAVRIVKRHTAIGRQMCFIVFGFSFKN